MSTRTWLRHNEGGGTFHCPDEAVDQWCQNGWEPCEEPEEPNPAVADRVAQEAALAAAAKGAPEVDPDPSNDAATETDTAPARRGRSRPATTDTEE